jgi:hypothetical protein
MANELTKEQFIEAESKMDENYCGLLAEHENYPLNSLFCMYLVQTRLSLEDAGLLLLSFIMRGAFEVAETLLRIDRLQKNRNRIKSFSLAT